METSEQAPLKIQLEPNKPNSLRLNLPCRYVITTAGGSIIEGIMHPDTPLTITPSGDIADIRVFAESYHGSPLHLVEDNEQ